MKRHVFQHARRARKSHQAASAQRARRRLGIQALEDRALLAADVGYAQGYVTINGTEASDSVEMYADGGQFIVNVSERDATGSVVSSNHRAFAEECVEGVFFNGNGGDDVMVNGTDVPTIAMGGAGNDLLVGGGGHDLLNGESGDDILIGSGSDLMMGGAGNNLMLDNSVVTPTTPPPAETPEEATGDDETCAEAPVEEPEESEATGDEEACAETSAITATEETGDEAAPVTDETPVAEETTEEVLAEESDVADDSGVVEETVEVTATAEDCTADPVEDTPVSDEVTEDVSDDAGETPDCTDPAPTEPVEEPATDAGDDSEPETTTPPVVCATDDGVATPTGSEDDGPATDDSAPVTDEEPAAVEDAPESDDDMIVGGLGDDFIYGGGGDDMLFGGDMDAELLGDLALNWLTAHSGANA